MICLGVGPDLGSDDVACPCSQGSEDKSFSMLQAEREVSTPRGERGGGCKALDLTPHTSMGEAKALDMTPRVIMGEAPVRVMERRQRSHPCLLVCVPKSVAACTNDDE